MNDLQLQIIATAENGVVAFGDKVEGTLDYTEKSLEVIEQMLEEAATHVGEMSAEQRSALTQYVGCYVFEVGRLEFGGTYKWHPEHEQPVLIVGEPEFHVAMRSWDKVHNRLNGDDECNIPFFYAGFAERVRTAQKGDQVIYV